MEYGGLIFGTSNIFSTPVRKGYGLIHPRVAFEAKLSDMSLILLLDIVQPRERSNLRPVNQQDGSRNAHELF